MLGLESIREEFPALAAWRHFDSARKAPLPRVALDAMNDWLEDVHATGGAFAYSERLVEEARSRLATLAGTGPEHIAFTSNASEGINYVSAGLDWRPKDNVVITSQEHPANVLPWRRLADRGVELRVASGREDAPVHPERILDLVDERTRVISVSWVSYAHGHRLDVRPLANACRSSDRLLVIDGIQGMGLLNQPLPGLGADVFVSGAHKGLFGLPGSGFVYTSERALRLVKPVFVGRHSFGSDDPWEASLQPTDGARRFEYGNRNYLGIAVLGATASWLHELGLEAVEQTIRRASTAALEAARRRHLEAATSELWSQRASIVTLRLPAARSLRDKLRERGYLVSAKSDAWIRLSFQLYHDEDRARDLIDTLADCHEHASNPGQGAAPR